MNITGAELKRIQSGKPISEAYIEATCTEWLELDGWRALTTDPKQARGLGVSERGIPDKLYIRYRPTLLVLGAGEPLTLHPNPPVAEMLWIEWKRIDGKTSQRQRDWHAIERMRGALVWVARVTFPATIEGFQVHYRGSGLMRRKI